MSLNSTVTRNNYTGNATASDYNFTFKVFATDEIKVIITDLLNVETELVLAVDYQVSLTSSGGTVELFGAGSWLDGSGFLKSGYGIAILRNMQLLQETDFRNQGEFFAEVHEDTFDKLVMYDQQQQDELDRSVKLAKSINPLDFDSEFPSEFVGASDSVVKVNSTGDGFAVGPTTTEIANAEASATAAAASAAEALVSETAAAASAASAATALAQYAYGDRLDVLNLSLTSSVAGNALTIAVKTKAGTNPSPSDPVIVEFITNGTYSRATLSTSLSLTISSGSTLGHSSGVKGLSGVYLIKNGSSIELAIGSTVPNFGSLISTTTEGGAGAADSALTIYSQTARTNVPFSCVGFFESTQTTAGTWLVAPTLFLGSHSNALLNVMKPTVTRLLTGSGNFTSLSTTKRMIVEMVGAGGGGAGSGTGSPGTGGTGGNTTFGTSLLTANGGGGGSTWIVGSGGGGAGVTINSPAITIAAVNGSSGMSGGFNGTGDSRHPGGIGGPSAFGGAGLGSTSANGGTAATNSGSGGGGAGTSALTNGSSGGGGGSGGYGKAEIYNSGSTTYAYSVGNGGTSGASGTSGFAGGEGAKGIIIITEYPY